MPINVLICYVCGALIGFLVIKYSNPPKQLEKLIVACCAAGWLIYKLLNCYLFKKM